MARVLCVGAAVLDTVYMLPSLPSGGGKYLPTAAYQFAAGMASSAAAAIARLGGTVSLWASVGLDEAGKRVISELTAEAIDCSGVQARDGIRTAMATTLVDAAGERMVVPYYDPRLREPADWLDFSRTADFDAVLVDVRWPTAAEPVLRAARENGVPTILDADVSPLETLERLAPLADYPIFSEPAAYLLSGEKTIDGALGSLAERLGGMVAITAGPLGTYYQASPGAGIKRRPAPRVDAVDTLSAGDVYHGAFALATAEGSSLEESIDFANAAAALKCTRPGGRLGSPNRKELADFLKVAGR